MTPRELDQGKRLLQRIQNIPLSGPELDEGFCVFALRVCSAESVGRRKLIPGKYYFFLEGFSILQLFHHPPLKISDMPPDLYRPGPD